MRAAWEPTVLASHGQTWLSLRPASCRSVGSSWEVTDLPVFLSVK